jgi:hypothetical protein
MVRKAIKSATEAQIKVCGRIGAAFVPSSPRSTVGLAIDTLAKQPIHGLRHLAVAGTTGWFVWAGEWSDDPAFFKSVHVEHLDRVCPEILPYLGLAPGWRFLIAPGHEDVWFEQSIVHV